MDKNFKINCLTYFGLSEEDAETFISLLDKMNVTEETKEVFERNMYEADIPYEGGADLYEAVTFLLMYYKK